MIPEYFAIIGAIIGSLGGFFYLRETVLGRAKPNRVTWLLWGLFPMIAFTAQRVQGVAEVSWTTFAAGFTPLIVVLVSFFNRKAYWKTERKDYVLMAAAIAGIVLWAFTRNPNLAIFFSLTADVFASLPTFLKAWRHPETESGTAYGISAVGFGIGMLALPAFTFENAAFLTYVFLLNAVLAVFAFRRKT
ncbi:MAG: hypothetical protein R2751_00830 [Bacteroidales bacterium]